MIEHIVGIETEVDEQETKESIEKTKLMFHLSDSKKKRQQYMIFVQFIR